LVGVEVHMLPLVGGHMTSLGVVVVVVEEHILEVGHSQQAS